MTVLEDPAAGGDSQKQWKVRAATHGGSPRAVLLKGIPDSTNAMIDSWHCTVLRHAFQDMPPSTLPLLDVGCGYGRLAREAVILGIAPVVGIDFTPAFCQLFQATYGDAVCGNLDRLPFANEVFSNAYAVTALMYLDIPKARRALESLGLCLASGARILILEPGFEFNRIARYVLRAKKREALTRPGFTFDEFQNGLAPRHWKRVASGSNIGLTVLLPALLLCKRSKALSKLIGGLCARLDRPAANDQARFFAKFALHRWSLYELP